MTAPASRTKPNRLKVLPHRLALAALQKEQLASCTHALLKVLLFPKSQGGFFSFTDSSDDITLVLEDDCVPLFPAESLQCTSQRWRAIKFDEGPLGFESTGIVSSVATPLAKAKICLYYVSSFTTGYTLVEENMLESAIQCLKTAGFTFNDLVLPHPPTLVPATQKINTTSPSSAKTQMVISPLPYKLYMANLPKQSTGEHAKLLIQLLCYTEGGDRFFSFTETPDEVSLILDMQSVGIFSEGTLTTCSLAWRILQICEGSYGSHGSETISKFAQPLADACISIFNVSTYYNDYTLIGEENMEKSLTELRKRLNIILDEDELEL